MDMYQKRKIRAEKREIDSQESSSPQVSVSWFPGHMTKTKRKITADLKLVDAVAEIIDARVPMSSRNPDIAKLVQSKPLIVLLNKCDMADPTATAKWIEYFKNQGIVAIPVDCKTGKGLNKFIPTVKEVLADKITAWQQKGMKNRSIRVMVVGIPNVGKSSFINCMSKQSKAKTADKPGVTRGNQWFTIAKGFEILDTPGVLWPKFDDKTVGERLAFTGAIKDQIIDTEQLSYRLLEYLNRVARSEFYERFKSQRSDFEDKNGAEMLQIIGKKRGMLISGGEVDTDRASIMVIDEFRAAKLGRITLELPTDYN